MITNVTNNRDQNDDSSWFQYEQDSIHVVFSRGICSHITSNIQFDEIEGGVQHVLTDLTLTKANGPKCSYAGNNSVEYTHRFRVDQHIRKLNAIMPIQKVYFLKCDLS